MKILYHTFPEYATIYLHIFCWVTLDVVKVIEYLCHMPRGSMSAGDDF